MKKIALYLWAAIVSVMIACQVLACLGVDILTDRQWTALVLVQMALAAPALLIIFKEARK